MRPAAGVIVSQIRPVARHKTVGAMLAAVSAADPEKTALVFGERRRSYKDLDETSNRIANALVASGNGRPAMIGILGRNSDRFVEILFGAVKSGGTAVVANWRLAPPELRLIIEDAGLAALFYDVEFASTVELLAAALPSILWIPFDTADNPHPAFQTFIAGHATLPPALAINPDDPAIMMYTSGTTGRPKGVPASHYAICFAPENMQAIGDRGISLDTDINLLTTPLFHLAGIGWLHSSIFAGATLVILPAADLPAIVAAIAAHRVTRATVLPALMPALLDAVGQGVDLSSLRLIAYGASPIPESLLARMLANFSCDFLQNYGMTENSTSATGLLPEDHYPGSPFLLSCGKPYPHVELRTVNERGVICGAREIGEIELRSPTLFTGYWRQPEATASVWRDGWYVTGDMGYLNENGYLFLVDRKKDMIISGGENIYPAEVESAISAHPDVVRAAVIGVPSERWGEEVKAIVILRENSVLDSAGLIAFLRPMIAGYKLPKSVDFVTELPLTAVGKIAKPLLRERYWPANGRRIN
jgi:acyl-CoA synthetase (AMP-forming)/AMP-acid ligase II